MKEQRSSNCTVCDKKVEQSVLIEIQLEMNFKYISESGQIEDMNGFWKKTKEYFCESCFDKYTKNLQSFYDSINKE